MITVSALNIGKLNGMVNDMLYMVVPVVIPSHFFAFFVSANDFAFCNLNNITRNRSVHIETSFHGLVLHDHRFCEVVTPPVFVLASSFLELKFNSTLLCFTSFSKTPHSFCFLQSCIINKSNQPSRHSINIMGSLIRRTKSYKILI